MRETMNKLWVLPVLLCLPSAALADGPGFHDELLDHLTGQWVMTGIIDGDEIVHDLSIQWVLGHWYLQILETSREKNDEGQPVYEAIVYIGWDTNTERYACLWLDVTGGDGLTNGVIGYAQREGDSIPFVFETGEDSAIHNTFAYDAESNTWNWDIDIHGGGAVSQFARVTLSRP